MAIQLIFCVETNKRADTDSIYVSETLRHLYVLDNRTKITKVYMNTKSKFQSKDVQREIAKKTKEFVIGKTSVIYCIDTDNYEKDITHKKELEEIRKFCREHDYDFIWFCHDVEDVYLGRRISDDQKVREAGAFRSKGKIKDVKLDNLSGKTERVHTSNILLVLDQYLTRKECGS